ncbi:MAG: Hsp20/alpha crystallin family protein, partial [Bacteroidota bacterium]
QIEVAVPGLKKEDFNVEINENILTVSSEKKAETEQKEEGRYTRREFHYSTFSRSFTLPKNVDAEKIEANYSEGILNITLPKLGEVKQPTKNITIK